MATAPKWERIEVARVSLTVRGRSLFSVGVAAWVRATWRCDGDELRCQLRLYDLPLRLAACALKLAVLLRLPVEVQVAPCRLARF